MMQIVKGLLKLRDHAKMVIIKAQQLIKDTYPVKSIKQTFKIGDQVTMWQTLVQIQGKFVPRRKGSYEIVSILGNGTYKLADEWETLKILINGDLLKLYKSYEFLKPIIVID